MSDTLADQLLAATLETWLERRRATAGFHEKALPDVHCQMLTRGVLARAPDGSLMSRAGGSPDDILEIVRREAPHLFKGSDSKGPDAALKPDPRGLSPSARLALANGHPPIRPEGR